jgi:hypothetical protein
MKPWKETKSKAKLSAESVIVNIIRSRSEIYKHLPQIHPKFLALQTAPIPHPDRGSNKWYGLIDIVVLRCSPLQITCVPLWAY